ncbi:hypothetical protein EV702DRAFT_1046970 [Suillus placidus]|uniref:Uncharacterized protein n=1 Tax=Suillus placidus TaxID=48579 RepID=A0A9P7D075_9AGAM|nr:hypothetical protein EV702DRAFT_1046970 [Suillus placidus]
MRVPSGFCNLSAFYACTGAPLLIRLLLGNPMNPNGSRVGLFSVRVFLKVLGRGGRTTFYPLLAQVVQMLHTLSCIRFHVLLEPRKDPDKLFGRSNSLGKQLGQPDESSLQAPNILKFRIILGDSMKFKGPTTPMREHAVGPTFSPAVIDALSANMGDCALGRCLSKKTHGGRMKDYVEIYLDLLKANGRSRKYDLAISRNTGWD